MDEDDAKEPAEKKRGRPRKQSEDTDRIVEQAAGDDDATQEPAKKKRSRKKTDVAVDEDAKQEPTKKKRRCKQPEAADKDPEHEATEQKDGSDTDTDCIYEPELYKKAWRAFLNQERRFNELQGKKFKRADLQDAWHHSDMRKAILKNMSVSDMRRRRLYPYHQSQRTQQDTRTHTHTHTRTHARTHACMHARTHA
jgi:hypothetical protein